MSTGLILLTQSVNMLAYVFGFGTIFSVCSGCVMGHFVFAGPSLADDSANATVLDLAHGNTVASRDLASQLSRVTTGKPDDGNRSVAASVPRVMKPTAGERLAHRVSNAEDVRMVNVYPHTQGV